jgi:FdhD protein
MVRRPGGVGGLAPDRVIVEEPMEIRLDDHLVTTTMRTPGHDYELAVGFLHGEGLLAGASVTQVRYCATGSAVETEFNVVSVETGGRAPVPAPRLVATGSACGLCGSQSIEELTARLQPLDEPAPVDPTVLAAIADRVRAQQELFDTTGSVHAAAAFDARTGDVVIVREDIGRHNAVDKVVGHMLLDARLPATGLGLFVSGRASFEMVQKAWAGGFGLVAAVSGPSSLAVEVAEAANVALVGFLRGEAMNVYVPVTPA